MQPVVAAQLGTLADRGVYLRADAVHVVLACLGARRHGCGDRLDVAVDVAYLRQVVSDGQLQTADSVVRLPEGQVGRHFDVEVDGVAAVHFVSVHVVGVQAKASGEGRDGLLQALTGSATGIDVHDHVTAFSGMTDPTGTSGNIAVNAKFTSASTYDFTLKSTSALINAGDPATLDADGSRADIGAYGGPGGDWL